MISETGIFLFVNSLKDLNEYVYAVLN